MTHTVELRIEAGSSINAGCQIQVKGNHFLLTMETHRCSYLLLL